MTREDVLAMPAGAALDALVAERLLGWKWWRSSETGRRALFGPGCHAPWFKEEADGTEELCRDVAHRAGAVGLADFSSLAGPAWLLVETLREERRVRAIVNDSKPRLTFEVHAQELDDRNTAAHWWGYACYFERGQGEPTVFATADTLPLAICRAALLTTLEETRG